MMGSCRTSIYRMYGHSELLVNAGLLQRLPCAPTAAPRLAGLAGTVLIGLGGADGKDGSAVVALLDNRRHSRRLRGPAQGLCRHHEHQGRPRVTKGRLSAAGVGALGAPLHPLRKKIGRVGQPSASFRPARPTRRRLRTMNTTRVRIDPDDPSTLPEGRIDPREGGCHHRGGDCCTGAGGRRRGHARHGALRAPSAPTARSLSDRVGAAHRRADRDDPQLGTGEAAAPPAQHAPCCGCSTRLPRPRSAS